MTVAVLGLATAVTAQVEDNTHQPYKGFSWGYCTYYAAQVFDRFAAAEGGIDWRGNGGMWLRAAQEKGWQTSTNPRDARVGAIIVWQNDGRGHVGVVDDVYPDGILISEMNWRVNSDGDATGGFNRISQSFLPFSTNLDRGVRRRYFFCRIHLPGKGGNGAQKLFHAGRTWEGPPDSDGGCRFAAACRPQGPPLERPDLG